MININKKEFLSLSPICFDNSGYYGSCYLYGDEVLKVFENQDNLHGIIKNITNNLGVNIDDFAFPSDIANVDGYVFSYIMPKIEGIAFNNILSLLKHDELKWKFSDLANIYQDGINKILNLNKLNIASCDLSYYNSMINENSIRFFDTDFYKRKKDSLYVKKNNLEELETCFKYFLIELYEEMSEEIKNEIPNMYSLFSEYSDITSNYDILNKPHFVDDLLEDIYSKTKIDSVNDLIRSRG